MKVLLINGSPNEHGCTYTALSEVAMQLNKNGIETTIFHIGKKPIGGCLACCGCYKNNGFCVHGDKDVAAIQTIIFFMLYSFAWLN